MNHIWQLQEAKAKFSELVNAAVSEGPQIISRHGVETVVILSKEDFERLKPRRKKLITILKNGSKMDGFDVVRSPETGRTIEL